MTTTRRYTQVHGEPSDQVKQGARSGARGARCKGCTGCTFSIERAPVPQNLSDWEKEADFILRWAYLVTEGIANYRRISP